MGEVVLDFVWMRGEEEGVVGECGGYVQPKIMAKAMPPMPRKGANLGSSTPDSAMMGKMCRGCVRLDGGAAAAGSWTFSRSSRSLMTPIHVINLAYEGSFKILHRSRISSSSITTTLTNLLTDHRYSRSSSTTMRDDRVVLTPLPSYIL